MASPIEIVVQGTIARPIDEVRAQFADIAYHSNGTVHQDIKYTVHESKPGYCRYTQVVSVMGLKLVDENITKVMGPDVVTETIDGANKGSTIRFTFESLGEQTSIVKAHFSLRPRGIKRFLAPILK